MPLIKFVRTEHLHVTYPYHVKTINDLGNVCEITRYTESEKISILINETNIHVIRQKREPGDGVVFTDRMYFCSSDTFDALIEKAKIKIDELVI